MKCRDCGEELTKENWYLCFKKQHRKQCRNCAKIYTKQWKKKNPEKYERQRKNFYERHRNYIREKKRERKAKFVEMLGGRCQNSTCSVEGGYERCIAALEFHHLDPKMKEKEDQSWQGPGFEEEIKKGNIQLLCANCHREVHNQNLMEKN